MTDVTRILSAIERGEAWAVDELLPIVFTQMLGWQHSGFAVHLAVRLAPDDLAGRGVPPRGHRRVGSLFNCPPEPLSREAQE